MKRRDRNSRRNARIIICYRRVSDRADDITVEIDDDSAFFFFDARFDFVAKSEIERQFLRYAKIVVNEKRVIIFGRIVFGRIVDDTAGSADDRHAQNKRRQITSRQIALRRIGIRCLRRVCSVKEKSSRAVAFGCKTLAQMTIIVAVFEGVIAENLRQRRLQRIKIERSFLTAVVIGAQRAERQIISEIETRKNIVLTVCGKSRKAEISRRRLVFLKTEQFVTVVTAPNIENEIVVDV